MSALRRIAARIAGMFTAPRQDADAAEEMAAHLEMEIAENRRRGMSEEEARRQALLASGGLAQAAEAVREQRGLPWLEDIGSDFRYAARNLVRNPGFAAVVALTLALGIGANTAIFSVVRGVLLKPLPNREGDRLVYLHQSTSRPEGANIEFSVPEVRDLRSGVPALGGGIAEYSPWNVVMQEEGGAHRLRAGLVTGNYFQVMGLGPVLGRLTRPTDDGPGVPPVVVLTWEFWQQHFRGDSGIVGKELRIDGQAATVIGVLQQAPFFPRSMDVLMNMVISPHHIGAAMQERRNHRMTEVVARLATGATLEQARSEIGTVLGRLRQSYPDAYNSGVDYRIAAVPFKAAIGERARTTLWMLMATAVFVLIIAAANVANLTLMRGVRREHELVVRASLGAGLARLRRLLLAENLLVSLIGAAAGTGIALAGVPLLAAFAARYSPRAGEIHVDTTVLGFALVLAAVVALLLSLAAFVPSDGMLTSVVSGGRRQSGGVRRQRLQRALVVVQVAVSVVLLAGAGLLTRTTMRLAEVPTGLDNDHVLTMEVDLFQPLRSTPERFPLAWGQYTHIRDELAAQPGVHLVGIGSIMPLRTVGMLVPLTANGSPAEDDASIPRADYRSADPDYFAAAGIPLLQGRAFQASDRDSTSRVVIINQLLARRLFGTEDPIGRSITPRNNAGEPQPEETRTVIGVVGNTQDGGPEAEPVPAMFVPFGQGLMLAGGFVVRGDSNIAGLQTQATRLVRSLAPTAPIDEVMTIAEYKDLTIAPRRLNAILVSAFGLLALLISAVGLAGVLAFSVSARTTEIGIRLSVGAEPGAVERMILGEGGILVVAGLAIGSVGALALAGVLRGLLFGVPPRDPVTFVTVVVVMLMVGLVACWLPAARAARIDPAITLRA